MAAVSYKHYLGGLLFFYTFHSQFSQKQNKMVEKIEDLNIPIANVARIIKDSLPSNASVSKEARAAIGII